MIECSAGIKFATLCEHATHSIEVRDRLEKPVAAFWIVLHNFMQVSYDVTIQRSCAAVLVATFFRIKILRKWQLSFLVE